MSTSTTSDSNISSCIENTTTIYDPRKFNRRRSLHFGDILGSNTIERMRRDIVVGLWREGFPYSRWGAVFPSSPYLRIFTALAIWCRRLTAHKSCVNYLTFSRRGGRWLASAGDDFRVQLWDFHQDDVQRPSWSYMGPTGNVLSLDFSATNQYLISGGADNLILRYDISRIGSGPGQGTTTTTTTTSSQDMYRRHDMIMAMNFYFHFIWDSVRSVSAHPFQDDIFLSASEDGKIILHDARVDRRLSNAQGTLQQMTEFTGVQMHPVMEHIFATCDSHGQVHLRDTRMAFGPLSTRSNHGIVQIYNTKLSKRCLDYLSNPESSSLTFDRDGSKLAVTMLHWFPTIYALSDPHPLAVCTGHNNPDGTPVLHGEKSYSNSCTMKSGAFGGPGLNEDVLYGAGSDDFRGYVWQIPELGVLAGLRREIKMNEWFAQEWPDVCAYSEGQWTTRYVPLEISTPLSRLNGHSSIVNAVAMHPSLLHIVTSGIERHVVLHSPKPTSPTALNLSLTPSEVREVRLHDLDDQRRFLRALIGPHPTLHEEIDEASDENETISLFDHIIRTEGNGDVFELRRWRDGESEHEDDEDEEEEDSDEDEVMVDMMDSSGSSFSEG
ncbi:WD40 repeat-like protein [Phlebopus sp. FC_14]|nr:WD40 repeat-like protein [Phlebopus sp. FC_14]